MDIPGIHFPRGNGLTVLPSEGQTDTHLPVLEEAPYKPLGLSINHQQSASLQHGMGYEVRQLIGLKI